MTKGRDVPEQLTYTFASGKTVGYQRIPQGLVDAIRRGNPAPEPPLADVEVMGEKKMEPNPADPDYQEALKQHDAAVAQKIATMTFRRGVTLLISDEQRDAELAALQEDLAQDGGVLDISDPKMAYIINICAIDPSVELLELTKLIYSRSMPTEEAVADAISTFRPNVSGA